MDFAELVGLQVDEGGAGEATATVDAGPQHLNPHGSVHGGLLATMLDAAMGAAARSAGGSTPVTVALTVTYLEPARAGRLTARAAVRKRGRRLLVIEGEVVQGADVVADALGTFSVGG